MMKRFSLSQKLIIAILLILLPVFVVFLYTYYKTEEYLKNEILKELGMVAQGYEGQVYEFLEMAKRRVSDFSSDGAIKDGLEVTGAPADGGTDLSLHLRRNKITLDKTIDIIHVISDRGRVVASTDLASIGKDLSGEKFFLSAGKTASVTESVLGAETVLVASSPVLNKKGERSGTVANVILLSELDGLLTGEFKKALGSVSSFERPGSMMVYLVDRRMRKISDSLPGNNVEYTKMDILPVRNCVGGASQTSAFYETHGEKEVAGVSVCIPSMGWTLLVELDREEALAPSRGILHGAFTSVAIVLLLVAGLLIVFVRMVVEPLQTMAGAAKEIAGGNYDISMPAQSADEIGTLAGAFTTMARDIQKGTEALRQGEKRLKRAQQMARIGSWEWDSGQDAMYYSEEVYGVFGLSPEALGDSLARLLESVHPKDRRCVEDGFLNALSGTPLSIDLRLLSPEGERIIHIQAESASAFEDKILSGTAQDITERKRLEESRAHLARIIDLTTDLVATATPDGKVLYYNQGGRSMLGITENDKVIRIEDTYPEWAARLVFKEGLPTAEREGVWSGETEFLNSSGESIPASQVIIAHRDVDGEVQLYSTIARDISERKAAEQTLLRKTEELDQLNSELHALTMKITVLEEKERKRLAEVLHEGIGQNLVAIRLSLKNCFKGLDEASRSRLGETLAQIMEFLDESIRISRTMTSDLYSAPLRDKGLRNSIEWYTESILRPQGIDVRLKLDGAVEALTAELQQVIFSIVRESFQNITKYAEATEVKVSCLEHGPGMLLTIQDNGKGFIQEEARSRKGRGFGLILMREWVKSISGDLSIQSIPGKGTGITVQFPANRG